MQLEMNGIRGVFEIVKRSDLPANVKPLPAVWAFKCK